MTVSDDYFASTEADDTQDATVYTASGQDWDDVVTSQAERGDELLVVNMGPQHPSTHGVLRLILEMDGESIKKARGGIGYLHTGIEKNMEFRTFTQGVTFCTRMDYLTPFSQEAAYSLAVENLLGIRNDIPEKANVIRVLLLELNRISSHLICIGTGANELGATTIMTVGFRNREKILDVFEAITGLRMNHGYIRPGGVPADVTDEQLDVVDDTIRFLKRRNPEIAELCNENPIYRGRHVGVGYLDESACLALGISGPMLRSTGNTYDIRKEEPYLDYESYDFDVAVQQEGDAFAKFLVRQEEMRQSLRIVEQCVERLRKMNGKPVMVDDPKIAWPSQMSVGNDGIGNSNEHLKHIMGESMEALIHHFKIVTEGFRVPIGQSYVPIESPKGEMGAHVVSDGGTRPWRAHFRDPSFNNLQAIPALCEGGMMSDVIVAVASIDPVMGGVDR